MIDRECNKNVFELWQEGGQQLPFTVVRWTWNPANSAFLVEKIEVKKWPYGTAWGRFLKDGVPGEYEKLSCAGSYQWKTVD